MAGQGRRRDRQACAILARHFDHDRTATGGFSISRRPARNAACGGVARPGLQRTEAAAARPPEAGAGGPGETAAFTGAAARVS